MKERKYLIDNDSLFRQWNHAKNSFLGLSPEGITCGSKKIVWWKCEKNHEWQEQVEIRNRGYGCPYCSGKRPIVGENDFATIHPELLGEWDYSKNKILPSEIMPSSGKKIWWKCEKGHSWIAKPNNRHNGTGCPICSKEAQTSFPEMALFFYLSQCCFAENRKRINGNEIDIYIPSLQVGVEYNGVYYHNRLAVQKRDHEKRIALEREGIVLICVSESDRNQFDHSNGDFQVIYDANYSYIETVVQNILRFINDRFRTHYEVDVNIGRDRISILGEYKSLMKRNSIKEKNPMLTREWNYSKNENLMPEHFSVQSKHIVWWQCERGHEWQASIYSRSNGNGCPYCANQKVLQGYNDLATISPSIAAEWNYARNGILKPTMVVGKTSKRVWWICDKMHEWRSSVSNRLAGNNCPICANKKVLAGYNDFATWCRNNNNEILLFEFDLDKNPFAPSEITPFSGKKVWWICSKGHSYETYLTHRTQMKTSCPYCSHKALLSGYNDLATTHPEIASQWDYDRNGGITPLEVMAGSNQRKYWFICDQGHSYAATLLNRKKGQGCPQCYKNSPRFSRKKRISVYWACDHSYFGSFEDARDFCMHIGLDYEKSYSNIAAVCRRRQKTLMNKYILRYFEDDEFDSGNE